MIRVWRLAICAAFFGTALAVAGAIPRKAEAQIAVVDRQYQIKAAFIYNFLRYVDWPDSAFQTPQSPFVVGIVGTNPFENYLDRIARAKTARQRRIVIRRFRTMKEYVPCHLLFVSANPAESDGLGGRRRLAEAVKQTDRRPVLIVSDSTGFEKRGAAVNFFIDTSQNRIKMWIHLDVTDRAGLTVSSQLLGLQKTDGVRVLREE